jgi:hypothetical protein
VTCAAPVKELFSEKTESVLNHRSVRHYISLIIDLNYFKVVIRRHIGGLEGCWAGNWWRSVSQDQGTDTAQWFKALSLMESSVS